MDRSFLQSREWERFQQAVGRQTFRVEGVLVIKNPLPLNQSWLYAPRVAEIEDLPAFLVQLKKLAKEQGAIFAKVEPTSARLSRQLEGNFTRLKSSPTLQPQTTLLLDLTLAQDRLLEKMKSKTRYNIRLSQRHQIEVVEEKDITHFWNLAQGTGQRDGFAYHPKRYYQKMVEILAPRLKIFSAVKGEKVLASALILFWGKTAHYLHGASDWSQRRLMAPFALHWKIIKEAQAKGMRWYDFWGIAIEVKDKKLKTKDIKVNENHPWFGITRFKLGFAPQGRVVQYPSALDLIFRPFWYTIYSLAKKSKHDH
jgi:lipid II:glycine glycyltransferase (peptidoglycan interpeptide bridge formation enzyme)